MPDLIVPLGTGSKSGNDELRILLRSAERNFLDIGRVIVVTQEPPDWLRNAVVVRCDDPLKHNKDGNMIRKVMTALEQCDVHGEVVVTCDDTVFCQPQRMACCPVLFNRRGRECFADPRTWHRRLRRTFEFLDGIGTPLTHNYECHAPQTFDADALRSRVQAVDYRSSIGYGIFTLFRGLCGITGGIDQELFKRTYESRASVSEPMDRQFAGYNDEAFLNGLREKLLAAYPKKSKYEREH